MIDFLSGEVLLLLLPGKNRAPSSGTLGMGLKRGLR